MDTDQIADKLITMGIPARVTGPATVTIDNAPGPAVRVDVHRSLGTAQVMARGGGYPVRTTVDELSDDILDACHK